MKKRNRKGLLWKIVSLLAVLLVVGLLWLFGRGQQGKSSLEYSIQELRDRYVYLLTHAAKTNVHQFLRPVHFNIGDKFAASGTLILEADGSPNKIITANHLFSETQPGSDYYGYHIVTSTGYTNAGYISEVILDSMRKSDDVWGIEDIAFANIGKPSLINRTSKVPVSANVSFTSKVRLIKVPTVHVTSLVTGEQFDVVGEVTNDRGVVTWVMLYESMNGESGSGYWGENGRLYILSGTVVITERMRKDLEIPIKYRYISAMSAVDIKW